MLNLRLSRVESSLELITGRTSRSRVDSELQIDLTKLPSDRVVDEGIGDQKLERVETAQLSEVLGLCGKVNIGLIETSASSLRQEDDLTSRFHVREADERLLGLQCRALYLVLDCELNVEFRLLVRFEFRSEAFVLFESKLELN